MPLMLGKRCSRAPTNGKEAHLLAELAGLVNLQVGVDARLDEVELEIEGVRAKVLLKVRLDEVRAILNHALDTLAEHPEILKNLTQALDDLLTGRQGDALGTVDNVLTGLEDDGTLDELLKGRLEDVRDTLQEVLSQVGELAPPQAHRSEQPHLGKSEWGKSARSRTCERRTIANL